MPPLRLCVKLAVRGTGWSWGKGGIGGRDSVAAAALHVGSRQSHAFAAACNARVVRHCVWSRCCSVCDAWVGGSQAWRQPSPDVSQHLTPRWGAPPLRAGLRFRAVRICSHAVR